MIDTDKKVVKLLKTVEVRPKLATKKLLDEVFDLHERRPKTQEFNRLAKDQLRMSALRHRIAAVKMTILREKLDLERVYKSLDAYIRSKYQNYLDRFNIKTQNAFIDAALAPLTMRIATLADAVSVIDVCLEDYDKAGWTFKGVNESLSLGDRV